MEVLGLKDWPFYQQFCALPEGERPELLKSCRRRGWTAWRRFRNLVLDLYEQLRLESDQLRETHDKIMTHLKLLNEDVDKFNLSYDFGLIAAQIEALEGRGAVMSGGLLAPEREELSTRMRFKRAEARDEDLPPAPDLPPWKEIKGRLVAIIERIVRKALIPQLAGNMKKTFIAMFILVAGSCLSAAAPLFTTSTSTATPTRRRPRSVNPGSTFFVIENQKAQNPLLEKEVKEKIDKLLTSRAIRLVAYDKAQYYLFFSYGIGGERSATVVMPDYFTSYGFGLGGGSGWRGSPFIFAAPFFSFYPAPESLYDRWLLLNVVDAKYYREKGQFRTVWVGEARSTGTSSDLRVAINYLLLADFQDSARIPARR